MALSLGVNVAIIWPLLRNSDDQHVFEYRLLIQFGTKRVMLTVNVIITWELLCSYMMISTCDAESGNVAAVLQVGVTFNPQSTCVGTASMDTTARLWDVETGKEVSTLQVIDSAHYR